MAVPALAARADDRPAARGRRAREIVYDVQFTEPSDDPDEDIALYDADRPRRAA